LVFHEEKQAASCVGKMGEPGLWVLVLSTPPGEDVPAERCEIATPVCASAPIVS
jgi:hypothetical protein